VASSVGSSAGHGQATGSTAAEEPLDRPLNVGVLRAGDLESRELLLFDRLHESRLLAVSAIGDVPVTPYGVAGLSLDVQIRPSLESRLRSLPFGGVLAAQARRRLPFDVAHSPGLRRALAPFALVNARETFESQTARAVRLVKGRPDQRLVVSCFENIPFRYEDDEGLARNKDRVRAGADMFIANSPGAQGALVLEGVPPSRIELVPPGIDTDLFAPGPRDRTLRARWGADDDAVVILFAGRLLREKGLIEALLSLRELLASTSHRVRLVFHGAGPERPRLQRAVRTVRLEHVVAFSEWVDPSHMPDVYRSGDIVVLPSLATPYWREQFGFNLAEAMACGRPTVGASTGEIPWVVGHGGLIFDVERWNALSEVVESLMGDPARRDALGAAARQEAVQRFSVGVAGRRLVECFEAAMSRPARQG
jgi:starch synthase